MERKNKIISAAALVSVVILATPVVSSGNFALYALIQSLAATCLAGIFGYFVLSKLGVWESPSSPVDYGKTWFGYLFFIICITRLSSFASSLDIEYLAQFGVLTVFYGGLAFGAGYLYGTYKIKKRSGDK